MKAATSFHVGSMYEFYTRWLQQQVDMTQSGFFLRDLERYCKKNVAKVLVKSRRALDGAPIM